MNSSLDIEPVDGFWGNVGAYALGRNRNGFSYDVNGKSTGRTPLMGLPPDFGIGKPTALLNLEKNIRSLFAAKTGTALVTKFPAVAEVAGTAERTFLMRGQVIDRYGPFLYLRDHLLIHNLKF